MDEKAQAKAQMTKPEPPGAGRPAPPTGRWLKLGIAVALVAALGWGFAMGWGYFRGRSQPPTAPPPTAAAPATNTQPAPASSERSVSQAVETQSALEAYRTNLKFSDVMAQYEDDLLEGDVPVVSGKLENTGDRTLSYVEVTAYFLNADGKRIHEKKFPIVGGMVGDLMGSAPLRPGYIHSFAFKASDTPSEWATGEVEVEVTAIRFGQQ